MKKHTLYIGLFDKDSHTQKYGQRKAVQFVSTFASAHLPGCTVSPATGVYRHNDGSVVSEPSIRVETLGASDATIADIVAAVKAELNQESVLVEQSDVQFNFS